MCQRLPKSIICTLPQYVKKKEIKTLASLLRKNLVNIEVTFYMTNVNFLIIISIFNQFFPQNFSQFFERFFSGTFIIYADIRILFTD